MSQLPAAKKTTVFSSQSVMWRENLRQSLKARPGLSGDEIQLKLQKALLKLPDKQRLVFNMKYFDDMPYEQISEITDTSVGALKASYHHAVKKIEDFLSE